MLVGRLFRRFALSRERGFKTWLAFSFDGARNNLRRRSCRHTSNRKVSLHFANRGRDIRHILVGSQKDALRNVNEFPSCLFGDWRGHQPKITRPLIHQSLDRELTGDGVLIATVDGRTLSAAEIQEIFHRQAATTLLLIPHDKHVNAMFADAGMGRQRLHASDLSQHFLQREIVPPPCLLLSLEAAKALHQKSSLIFGNPAIPPERNVLPAFVPFSRATHVVEGVSTLKQLFVIRCESAAFPAGKVLVRLEAETRYIA